MQSVIQEYENEVALIPIGEEGRDITLLNKLGDKYLGYWQDEAKTQKQYTIKDRIFTTEVQMLDGSIKKLKLVCIDELNTLSYANIEDIKNARTETKNSSGNSGPVIQIKNTIEKIYSKTIPNRKIIALLTTIAITIIGFIIYKRKHK